MARDFSMEILACPGSFDFYSQWILDNPIHEVIWRELFGHPSVLQTTKSHYSFTLHTTVVTIELLYVQEIQCFHMELPSIM